MATTMRAIGIAALSTFLFTDIKNGKGPVEALFISDSITKPSPSDGQALVKIKAFGLNRMDLIQREGHYPAPPQAGKILGVEFSGIISELGAYVGSKFKVGDEVFGLAYGGAYAEYIAVSTQILMHKPAYLSWEECAGIPETWITAIQALYLIGCFKPGQSVLWHAGASSVSIAGIQLAVADKASAVYVTVGSDEKVGFCKNLGATEGFNYRTQDWSKEILRVTEGKGVDVVIDFVGQNYFQGCLEVAARDGIIVSLALLSGSKLPTGVDISHFLRKRLRYEGSSLRSRDTEYQGRLRNKLESLLPKFEDKTFRVLIEKVFKWTDIQEAHRLMESNQTKGKIICVID